MTSRDGKSRRPTRHKKSLAVAVPLSSTPAPVRSEAWDTITFRVSDLSTPVSRRRARMRIGTVNPSKRWARGGRQLTASPLRPSRRRSLRMPPLDGHVALNGAPAALALLAAENCLGTTASGMSRRQHSWTGSRLPRKGTPMRADRRQLGNGKVSVGASERVDGLKLRHANIRRSSSISTPDRRWPGRLADHELPLNFKRRCMCFTLGMVFLSRCFSEVVSDQKPGRNSHARVSLASPP